MITPGQEPPPDRTPQRAGAGFLLAMLLLLLAGLLLLNSGVLESSYAGIAFMGIVPFAIGALATGAGLQIYSHYGCIIAPAVIFAVTFAILHFTGAEGLVCILMVLPFWLVAGFGGSLATWAIHRRRQRLNGDGGASRLHAVGLLALPAALLLSEEANPPLWETRTVVRSIEIAAPAAEVWPLLLAIPAVRQDEGIATFTHDIASIPRPAEARLVQRGDRLVRLGRWGDAIHFEERVTRLVPGRAIGWNFAFPGTSVEDYTDRHISPDGPMLNIVEGGYTLIPLRKDRVRVSLFTTYRMRSRIGWYAGWWGELMLGDVHDNVLAIIRARAEKGHAPASARH